MSAPMCVATGLATSNVTFDALRHGKDPKIADLLSRCTVVPDPSRKPKSVQISVSLTDGRVLGIVIDNTDELLSWSTQQVHGNATRLLAETRWDDAQLKAVIDEIEKLQHTADLAEFIAVALR